MCYLVSYREIRASRGGSTEGEKDTVAFRIFLKLLVDIFSTRIMKQLSVLVLLFGFFVGKFHYTHGRIQKILSGRGSPDVVCMCAGADPGFLERGSMCI